MATIRDLQAAQYSILIKQIIITIYKEEKMQKCKTTLAVLISMMFAVGLCVFGCDSLEINYLGIMFEKSDIGTADFRYKVRFCANKESAVICELSTPLGTFTFINDDDEFVPMQDFHDSHSNLTFAELSAAIASNWTLTWDEGFATQTIATIGFGSITEGEWLDVPSIINPLDGSSNVSPDTSIVWSYTVPTLTAQKDAVEVFLVGPSNEQFSSDELTLLTTSWTPPSSLSPGSWTVSVENGISDFRLVEDGIGGEIVGDPWILDNGDWLSLASTDSSVFTVKVD